MESMFGGDGDEVIGLTLAYHVAVALLYRDEADWQGVSSRCHRRTQRLKHGQRWIYISSDVIFFILVLI